LNKETVGASDFLFSVKKKRHTHLNPQSNKGLPMHFCFIAMDCLRPREQRKEGSGVKH